MRSDKAWLPNIVFKSMGTEAESWAPDAETGGLLLGYWATPTEAVITHSTVAGPNAVHERARFVPDTLHDEEQVVRVFESTDGVSTYLGDWHTHPNSSGSLSWRDRKTLKVIASDPGAAADQPLMIVLTRAHGVWLPVAWRGSIDRFGPFAWLAIRTVATVPFTVPTREPNL